MSQPNTFPFFLVGFMASGKSKWGKVLAKRLDHLFIDMDQAITSSQNKSITQIFKEEGEVAFRKMENDWLAQLECDAPAVIACGGGAFESAENRKFMLERGVVIFVHVPFEVLWSRLDTPSQRQNRPLAKKSSKVELEELYEQRLSNYTQAQIHWNPVNQSLDELLLLIKTV